MGIARLKIKTVPLVPESIEEDIPVEKVPIPINVQVNGVIPRNVRCLFQPDTAG